MLDGVWGANSMWSFRSQQSFLSFSELLALVFYHQRNPVLFAFNIWTIWHQRNQVRTQQNHRPLNQISQWAHDSFVEFQALKIAPLPSRPVRRAQWKPPDKETFKINFDGAIFAEDKCSGLGVIIRDRKGLVMASMAARISQQLQPVEIEALAANKALEFAREMDIKDAVLEGDSLLVMKALNFKNTGLAPFGLLLQDSLDISSRFSKLSYSHTEREGNTIAHNLAQLAFNLTNCVIWMEDIPSDVMTSYHADLAGIS